VLLVAFAVALAAAVAIHSLSQWASRSAEAELALVKLKGELQALSALDGHAMSARTVDAELERGLQQAGENIATLRRALQKDSGAADLTALWTHYERYEAALGRQAQLVKSGDRDAAHVLDETVIDPTFEQLQAEIGLQARANSAFKSRIGLIADLGMVAALLIAAAVIAALFARFSAAQMRQTVDLRRTLDELQRAQDQLVQSEKLAALGQLIAGIAHEINTPLGAIRAAAGNADKALRASLTELPKLGERLSAVQQTDFFALIEQALTTKALVTAAEKRPLKRQLTRELEAAGIDDARSLADLLTDIGVHDRLDQLLPLLAHPQRDWLLKLAYDLTRLQGNADTILQAVERASKVVFALKSYARFDKVGDKRPVHLRQGLETVLDLYQSQIKQGVTVECAFAELPAVPGHEDELVQVWTNLIHNAVQAMGGDGRLHLATACETGHAVISVTDSGPGIPADIQQRIFEPFFTTKPSGEGSGLGLHICQKIVAKHDGVIKVDSTPGRTTFSVWLPFAPAVAA
jgi:signal transduction histidine kinase